MAEAKEPSATVPDSVRLAIGELEEPCRKLRDLLFHSPVYVVRGESSERSQRWLIQYVEITKADELVVALRELPLDEYLHLASFLAKWLHSVWVSLNPAGPPFDDPDLYVNPPGGNSWNSAAFDQWKSKVRGLESDFQKAADLIAEASTVSTVAEEVTRIADRVRRQAGGISADRLASLFDTLGRQERASARLWTILAAACLIGITVVAGIALNNNDSGGIDWKAQGLHLFLTLPFAALAAYSSRAASRHRQQAWWAASTSVQLHTVVGYTTPLDDESRSALLVQVGQRVFAQPAVNTSSQEPDSATLTASIDTLLSKLPSK